jgi:hypothetical protein
MAVTANVQRIHVRPSAPQWRDERRSRKLRITENPCEDVLEGAIAAIDYQNVHSFARENRERLRNASVCIRLHMGDIGVFLKKGEHLPEPGIFSARS